MEGTAFESRLLIQQYALDVIGLLKRLLSLRSAGLLHGHHHTMWVQVEDDCLSVDYLLLSKVLNLAIIYEIFEKVTREHSDPLLDRYKEDILVVVVISLEN